MKEKKIKFPTHMRAFVFALLMLTVPLLVITRAAGPANLYIASSADSVMIDQKVTITLKVNTNGGTAAGVDVAVSYDSAKLRPDTTSLNTALSPFDFTDTNSVTGGTIRYIAASVSNAPVNGDITLGTVTFTPLAAGSAAFTYTTTSVVKDVTANDITNSRLSKTVTISNYKNGDYNKDNKVDINDVILFGTDYRARLTKADIDKNGVVDINDAILFGQYYRADRGI